MMEFLWTLAQSAPAGESPWWVTWVPLIVMLGVFYLILLRPQMKQQREHQRLIDNIKKGDRVITSGGIWGEVDSVEAQFVRLRIAEKTKVVVSRSNIAGFQPKSAEVETPS